VYKFQVSIAITRGL